MRLLTITILCVLFSVQAQAQEDPFAHVDTDKNGAISLEESAAASLKSFEALDSDKDGKITRIEYTATIKTMMKGRDLPEIERRRAERVLSRRFTAIDKDQDDVITKEEFLEDNAAQQKDLDADGNGEVTPQEVEAKQAQWRDEYNARPKESTGEPPLE